MNSSGLLVDTSGDSLGVLRSGEAGQRRAGKHQDPGLTGGFLRSDCARGLRPAAAPDVSPLRRRLREGASLAQDHTAWRAPEARPACSIRSPRQGWVGRARGCGDQAWALSRRSSCSAAGGGTRETVAEPRGRGSGPHASWHGGGPGAAGAGPPEGRRCRSRVLVAAWGFEEGCLRASGGNPPEVREPSASLSCSFIHSFLHFVLSLVHVH